MDLIDRFNGVEMVDPWIQANFIHDYDPGVFDPELARLSRKILWLEGLDFSGDVACRYDIASVLDGAFDDGDMVGIWNERDEEIMLRNRIVQFLSVRYV